MKKSLLLSLLLIVPFGILISIGTVFAQNNKLTVQDNYLRIRLKSQNIVKKSVSLLSEKYNFEEMECILPKDYSIKYNKKNQLSLQSNNHINIDEVLRIEEVLFRTYTIKYKGKISPQNYARILLKDKNIEIAEAIHQERLLSQYIPNDPYYISYQHSIFSLIKLPEAWDIEKGNSNVVIGISDGGTEWEHEDLQSAIAVNKDEIPDDGIDNDKNGYIDDYYGCNLGFRENGNDESDASNSNWTHGTNVAGIASAVTDNNMGIAGVGFNTSIFPIRIDNGRDLRHTFESILYAARSKFKVLNCSWGAGKAYSEIEQSIIDYAVANDVAIVAAAGNLESYEPDYITYYPAGYDGVLGVGSTNTDDGYYRKATTVGLSAQIFAPTNIYTTDGSYGYDSPGSGTSFSAPLISGVVALVRSHYPELTAMQSLELVRQSVDDISSKNKGIYQSLLAGRINAYKALSTDPMSIPAIHPQKYIYSNTNGEEIIHFNRNDEVELTINAHNYLGDADNLTFILSEAFAPIPNIISILNDTINVASIKANEDFDISSFKIKINYLKDYEVFLRVDIYGDNGYHDFFRFSIVTAVEYATFENYKMKITMADRGEIGYYHSHDNQYGSGFQYKGYGNQLYQLGSALIATEGMKKTAYAYEDEFDIEKKYRGDTANVSILRAYYGPMNKQLGLEIKQTVGFVEKTAKSVAIDFEVKNIADKDLTNIAVGYLLDFDIGGQNEAGYNYTYNNPDALPEIFKENSTAQIIINYEKENEYPLFAAVSNSNEANAIPQAAGLDWATIADFKSATIIKALTSGTNWQLNKKGDVNTVIGMAFDGKLQVDEVKKFRICLVCGDDEEDLFDEIELCLGKAIDVVDDNLNIQMSLNPNPAFDFININIDMQNIFDENIDCQIYDMNSKLVFEGGVFIGQNKINIQDFANGTYIVKILFNNKVYISKFVVIR